MRLRIVTPLSVVVDEEGVLGLRAEDASGGFGILPRHADFLTSLALSVVGWTSGDGQSALLRRAPRRPLGRRRARRDHRDARGGRRATTWRRWTRRSSPASARDIETERAERAESTRLQLNAIRQIMRHLRPDRHDGAGMFA